MQTHSHSKLREQLRFILASCRPSLIQIEHAELSPLAALRNTVAPWILTLHDVLLSKNGRSCTEDEHELRWIRKYDAVIACSEEDAHLVPQANVSVVPNGAAVQRRKTVPSPDTPVILFAGPFRYQPNFDGIQTFLGAAYRRLRSHVPGVELWILGGDGAPETAAAQECFRQQGVRVMGYVEHPMEWLERCAVTINPLREVRGSCVKLIESIAAGRVCVSTREGARGFLDARLSGLVVTETVEDFVQPLTRLLCDSEYRRSLEYISEEALARFSWEHSAAMQSDLYRQWMRKYQTGSRAGC